MFVFRRVSPAQYEALVEYCQTYDVAYELKTLGRTLLFGLPREDWRRLDFSATFTAALSGVE
jgi:hypothetical protein